MSLLKLERSYISHETLQIECYLNNKNIIFLFNFGI